MSHQDNKVEEVVAPVEEQTCVPPKIFKRNEHGLLCQSSIKYVYKEDGSIDWRKMVKPEYLVPNKQKFESKGKPVPTSIEGLNDNEILILLGGLKELAQVRGFTSIKYQLVSPSADFVSAVCEIEWIPNFETEGRIITSSGMGDAHPSNTSLFVRNYLTPIAENRAFVRAVRNFLKINIVSQEEIGGSNQTEEKQPETVEEATNNILAITMKEYNISFDKVKAKLIEEKVENAENFKSVDDIPRKLQFELIGRIKSKNEKKS